MCDHSACISVHHTASLRIIFYILTPTFCLERDYVVAYEMCQEIRTRSVLQLLQYCLYGTDFITFFLLYCESRKQEFWLSPIL